MLYICMYKYIGPTLLVGPLPHRDPAEVAVAGVEDALPGDGGRVDVEAGEGAHLFCGVDWIWFVWSVGVVDSGWCPLDERHTGMKPHDDRKPPTHIVYM